MNWPYGVSGCCSIICESGHLGHRSKMRRESSCYAERFLFVLLTINIASICTSDFHSDHIVICHKLSPQQSLNPPHSAAGHSPTLHSITPLSKLNTQSHLQILLAHTSYFLSENRPRFYRSPHLHPLQTISTTSDI